jgi:hypothetical protein
MKTSSTWYWHQYTDLPPTIRFDHLYNGITISGAIDSMKVVPIHESGNLVGNLVVIEILK